MESKQLKVVIVGHSGVGKTSLIGRYIFDNFDAGSEATLGAVFHEKQHILPDKSTVGLEIWDTAGQERYRSIAKIYYKDAKVVLAVYDVTSDRSFNELKLWVDEVRSNSSKSTRLIVVGNKIDLLSEELYQNRGEATYESVKFYCG
jgi:small GTP-binding protein